MVDLSTFEGGVELVEADRELIGYAFDVDRPEASVFVDIRIDDRLVATVLADEPRMVLAEPRSSYCGWSYRLPTSLDHIEEGGALRLVEVAVANAGNGGRIGRHLIYEPTLPRPGHDPRFGLMELQPEIVRVANRFTPLPDLPPSRSTLYIFPGESFVAPRLPVSNNPGAPRHEYRQTAYQPRLPFLVYLADVIVDAVHGNVFLPDGRLWKACRDFRDTDAIAEARRVIQECPESIDVIDGAVGLIGRSGISNYWHWHECLCSLAQMSRSLKDRDVTILVPPLNELQADSVRFLSDMKVRTTDQLHRVKGAWVSSDNDFRLRLPDSGVLETFRTIKRRALAEVSPGNRPRRVLISRKDAGQRNAINEGELFAELATLGFEELVLSKMKLADQIAALSEAEIVVGVHGAGLTNIAHCPPGGQVFEIMPWDNRVNSLRNLAVLCGLESHWFFTPDMTNSSPFRIDIPSFMSFFRDRAQLEPVDRVS
ncbi:glycosyltransferase family 61 protein [Methylorubrum extorquens]